MRTPCVALLVASACLLTGVASAQSITTPPNFASNNGGSSGGAVYFDLTVTWGGPAGLTVTSLDTNCSATAGAIATLEVYTTPGSYLGVETDPAAWTLVSSGTGCSLGQDVPTPVNISDFPLPSGSYGIAIVNSGGHRYTNGNGTNQTVSGPHLSLSLGAATNVPFTGGIFSPRVWNGTIHYTASPQVLVTTSLLSPIGMVADAQDRLWIGEAGDGTGATGRVSRYDPSTGMLQTVLSGFPSEIIENSPTGVHHMAWDPQNADHLNIAVGGTTGRVQTWDVNSATLLPGEDHDVRSYVFAQGLPPGEPTPDSNVYSVAVDAAGDRYAVDAGANAIIRIDSAGAMSVFAQFPNLPGSGPPFVGQQAVPTKILADGNGGFWVCNLTGGPFFPGTASVFHVDSSGTITTVQTGFTTLVDMAVDPTDGRLAVLSWGQFDLTLTPPNFVPFTGTITKLTSTGTHTVASGLMLPTGMAYTSNGDLYVHSYALGSLFLVSRSQLSASLSQGCMGDLDIQVAGGVADDPYYLFHSFDPANGTFPGGGWLGGLHIGVADAFAQFTIGTQGMKIFGGALDPSGGVSIQVPPNIMQQFSGMQLWGVALTLTPGDVQFSNITTVTIQ